MNLHFLASGSKANCTVVEAAGNLIVVDAGLRPKDFLSALSATFPNVKDHMVSAIRAIVVSHHHSDHAGFAGELSGALHVPVYATSECLEAGADRLMRKADGDPVVFVPGEKFVVGAFRILPVETYHVRGAVGFRIETFEGFAAIFTDLPEITKEIGKAMEGCPVVCVEADYSQGMLAASSYVDDLKDRIRMTHMSNENLSAFFGNGFNYKSLRQLALIHLSRDSNLPFIAEAKLRTVVPASVEVTALHDGNLPLSIQV